MTDGVYLRSVRAEDLDFFFEQERDPQSVQMAAFTAENPDDRASFDSHWSSLMVNPEVMNRTVVFNGRVAGHVAKYNGDNGPEVTYWIGRDYWGKGIATSALKLFLAEYTARPVFARVASDNIASFRVLTKCGFVVVGKSMGYANARRAEIEEMLLRLDSP